MSLDNFLLRHAEAMAEELQSLREELRQLTS
jgi:hypothetical protein